MLWETMKGFLESWFNYPGIEWYLMLLSIGLAIVFGVIWLLGIQPRINKRIELLAVMIVSAFLAVLAMTFIQIPIQYYIVDWIGAYTYIDWMLLAGISVVLTSGLVQEGAKMVPMVFWWVKGDRKLDPKMGLFIGAIAGAGFGIFESVWAHGQTFMSGWTWEWVNLYGIEALIPFWERFWTTAFHIAVSAIAGYGLAKGKGYEFYLVASVLHGAVNYLAILSAKDIITSNQLEIILACIVVLIMLGVLWLRWRKDKEGPETPVEVIEPNVPDIPIKPDV